MATKLTVTSHQKRLETLRSETQERLEQLNTDYDALAEVGTDVGSGDDEGGSESDGTFVERDRIRAQIAEDTKLLDEIEAALLRAESDEWKTCSACGGPIGAARIEALPTTTLCVTCKASRTTW
jgi:RNA polymerase-binding transcription factor DksA